ncbi:MAG: hypothetical protein MUO26_11105 [Methanotrichaceae archaeon]|nr:hypothetical protein [Methanotrichaceae archaeon]
MCGDERIPHLIGSCPKCGRKFEEHKPLIQIEVTQNIGKANGRIVGVYIENVDGNLSFQLPRSSRNVLSLRGRIINDREKLKLILSFKNDNSNPIQIDGYRIEVTKGDRPKYSTGYKNGFPIFHTYGRIIDVIEDWQEKEFSWINAEDWKIIEKGEYQIKIKIVYEINGVYEFLSHPITLNY